MQLTKTKEKEILKVYSTWMTAYLNGDIATYDSFFTDDYHFIGSTNNEEFLNRKATTQFFKDTAEQFSGKTDLRNEVITLEVFNDLVFITHVFDAWFLNGSEWNYYSRFRFSSVLQKKDEGWKFIYQHFSVADSKTDEGETIGFDKVNTENQELRESIKRRTIELEAKNRELEIEGALERIRAQAVAMQQSTDLLDIVVTMRNEFIKLGHEAHYFWHMMWLPETYQKAMTSGDGSKIGFVMKLPRHMHGDIPLLAKWEKSKKPTVVYAMNTKEAIAYVDKMVALGDFQNIDPQAPTHNDIRHIGGLTFIMARTTHGEIGYSLPGIIKNPPAEDLDILVQFAGAFDLAHRRFLDLQKAEKQTREIQIELSLERIRSRVTAMQESSDLFNIVVAMRKEFISLGHEADYFWHMQWLKDSYEMSMTSEDGSRVGMVITIPKFVHDNIEALATWEKGNDPICILALNAEEAWDYIHQMNTHGQYKQADPNAPTEEDIHHIGGITFIIARTTHGEIGYSLPGAVENPPKAALNILLRFAGAFDLAHKRFEDLKRSEEQARETQIELALEKVRSRTMAMQHSDELQETSFLLDQQVRALGIETWGCAFHIYGKNDSTEWFGNEKGVLPTYTVPRAGIFKEYFEKGKKGEALFVKEFSGKACLEHYEFMSTLPVIGDVLKQLKKTNKGFPTYQIDQVVYFKYGYLLFITKEQVPDAYEIFKRFSKVFEQTYTRFLDLKKAEEQAREAQIEAALERTRTQSMLMQHSDELNTTAQVFHEQLQLLGIDSEFSYLWLPDEAEKKHMFWATWSETKNKKTIFKNKAINFPLDKSEPSIKACYVAWESEETVHSNPVKPNEVSDYFSTWTELLHGVDKFKPELFPEGLYYIDAYMNYGCFGIMIRHELSAAEKIILSRFSKEFQRTYTRFLDLQKAEAQAKEAQIEAALEKVRSRSLAVHKSDEFNDVVSIVFEKLKELQIPVTAFGIGIKIEGSKDLNSFVCGENEAGLVITNYRLPYFNNKISKDLCSAIDKGLNFYVGHYTKKVKNNFYKHILEHTTEFKDLPEDILKMIFDSSSYTISMVTSKHVVFNINDFEGKVLTEDEIDILKRFSKVFNQAYIRFLDLQKAEAQAREAQIEAALERVRSRSMAMHNSDEIGDVAFVLFQQLKSLGGEFWGTGFGFCEKNSTVDEFWFANENGIMPQLKVPNTKDAAHKEMYQGWKKGLESLSIAKDGKALKEHYKYMLSVPDIQPIFQGMLDNGISFPKWQKWHAAYFKYGYLLVITTEPYKNEAVFKRFAKVFQQAYTRFLDLQKAEEQAREAQIEAALERVRSQSMAMHTSDELKDVVRIIFEQMGQININAEHAGIVVDYEPKKDWHFWVAESQNIPAKITVPYSDLIWDKQFTEAKQNGKELFTMLLNFEEKNAFYKELLPHIEGLTQEMQEHYFKREGLAVSTAIQKDISLYIENFSGTPYTEEENKVLIRFAKAFQQTYTRFLDLQKAEAQTRQAQINLAVERVRAKALAMHKSEEIMKVVAKLKDEVMSLDIPNVVAATIFLNEGDDKVRMWDLSTLDINDTDDYEVPFDITFKLKKTDPNLYVKRVWENTEDYFVEIQKEKDFKRIIAWLRENGQIKVADEVEEYTESTQLKELYHAVKKLNNGKLVIDLMDPPSEEMKTILTKMGAAFDLAYKRFEDLQRAEAQTREAQIEAALEKVRSRSLAMHNTAELQEVVAVVAKKLQELGVIYDAGGVILCTYFPDNKDVVHWISVDDFTTSGRYFVPYFDNPIFNDAWDSKMKGDAYFSKAFTVKAKNEFFKHAFKNSDYKQMPDDYKEFVLAAKMHNLSAAWSKNSAIIIPSLTGTVPTENDSVILKRFAKVFEQAYSRFLDLQKAEEQAKDAQIESALERVRNKALAMHSSEDLSVIVNNFFNELKKLNISMRRCGVGMVDLETKVVDVHVTTETHKQDSKMMTGKLTLSGHPVLDKIFETFKTKEEYHPVLSGKELSDYYKAMNPGVEYPYFSFDETQYGYYFHFKEGGVFVWSDKELPEEDLQIFRRFTSVLSLTYRRYLDLKEAEAQTREAKIEAALEKVRSRTMAMQKGEELQDVVVLLYKELIALGVTNFATCGYVEINEETNKQATWVTNPGGDSLGLFYLPLTGDVYFDARYDAWQKQQTVFHQTVRGKKRRKHLEYAITTFQSKEAEEMVRNQFPDPTVFYCFNFSHGYLHLVAGSLLTNVEEALLARFTKVFEQTYARFLDLKKAEAQAREAQIENALEKVRSRTMAMQKSTELPEAANNLFLQVQKLGIPAWSAGYCIWQDDEKHNASCNMSSEGEIQKGFILPSIGEGYDFFTPQKNGEHFYVKELGGEPLVKHYEFMRTLPIVGEIFDDFAKKGIELPTFQIFHIVYFKFGYVMFITYEAVPDAHDIFKRFGNVFEQTYTRFLDLERAEAQTREAQIEMALEKVRSRTMAMQHSDELAEAAQVLFSEVQALGIPSWSCGYNLLASDNKTAQSWMSSEGIIQESFILEFKNEPSFVEMYEFFESDDSFIVQELGGKALKRHYKYMKSIPSLTDRFENFEKEGIALPTYQINHLCKFSKGYLLFITYEKVPEAHDIFKRFTSVFEQTYTRFLDLKRAEAQAREAQIEAALERVRSQSIGMQSTNDFAQVTTEMFNQLRNLGEDLFATGIVFCDKHDGHVEQWHSIPNGGMLTPFIVPVDLDYIHQYRYDQWKKGEELFSIEIPSDFIEQHFEDIFKLPSAKVALEDLKSRNAPMPSAPAWEIDYGASFKNGYILASSLQPFENTDILPRFAKVFEQAYTRFLDLQTAEKNAYKSKVEAALERVRGRALAMQEPEELKEVANVLRTEMGILGIEELETSSIYILDEQNNRAECWYALKDASSKLTKLVSDHITMDFNKTWVGRKMLKFHNSKALTTSIVMQGKNRKEWVKYCEEQSSEFKGYYGDDIPDRTYHLYKFSHGAIGAASAGDISQESWTLLKRSASVFSLAYSRFKDLSQARIDLQKLKTAKQHAEEALAELQTTQKQLIQSEKMASLGELTAGIAHEIQNPLNFVNNFSDVSKELLEEMLEEIEAGDLEEAKAIMEDVIQNLDKINHHGKRADGIVKGMLQHSRASGDNKEATNINALADEYLRLAYHGLRAKDKSFNSELVTNFDDSIGNIEVIPQDIGRVILNLLTNAFYVVNEKKKSDLPDYNPTVSISTKRKHSSIEITVTDNGNGMPESVKEKIFQPFFTTKPTGEGTGLGLSMSYDIITKGHGGDLIVETKEGEGTTFTIEIPLKK